MGNITKVLFGLLLLSMLAFPGVAAPVTNGLVAYYDGSLSGNSLVDLSGNNNTGYATSVTQGTNQSTGANYIKFSSASSKIDISNNAQTNISGPISIEFIGSINTFSKYGALVSKYKSSLRGWYLSCSSSTPYNHARFGAVTNSGTKNCESDTILVAGQVYDLVATYDNNVVHIYINGVDSGSRTWNSPVVGSPDNNTIGYGSLQNGLAYCNCSMYTVRLYNRSLSSAEVLQNYNSDLWRYTTKTTPTITWSNPADITYGTPLSSTQLNAVATNPVTGNTVTGNYVYTPAAETVLSVGAHPLHADFTPTDTANYTTASKDVTINVTNQTTPTVTWSKPANITYGTALSGTQLNANASVPGNFVYTPAAGAVLGAGVRTLHVDFTPTDTANYTTASKDVTINISRTTPTVTWSNPANITYGTALSGTQLNANASVPGNFIYNPAAGTLLGVGIYTLHVDFTPLDTANYTNASKDVTINVIENSGLPVANFTANITSGLAPLSVQFNDSSQNAIAWSWNFGDGQTSPAKNPRHTYYSPGTYTVSLNASNAVGYNISTKSNLITVNPIPPVTNGLVAYYNGSLSGNSLVDLSGNNNTGYATSVTQGTRQSTGAKYINLNGVNSKIDISNNAQTNISSPISIEFIGSINTFSQYSALVSKYNNGIVGWYLSSSSATPYNHARFGAGLNSGGLRSYESNITLVAGQVYDIVATYDNNVTHIYVNGMDSADPRTWNSPIAGITNNIAIGYSYGLTYCNCSMYTVRLYNRSLSSAEVLQNYNSDLWRYTTKTTPTITWSNPADITYGTPLSSTQLNANASVPGNFTYTPAAGTVLGVGTQTLHVDFTPTDAANYTTASKDVNINVLNSLAADFSAAPTTGKAPLKVTFTDNSQEAPTSWSWNFGDKSTSTDKNPIHEYSKAGKYTVSLTIKNAAGNDTKTMSNYITAVKK